jgi:hypothetical protein
MESMRGNRMANDSAWVVYGLYDGPRIVYVGVTTNTRQRFRVHAKSGLQFTRLEVLSGKLSEDEACRKMDSLLADYVSQHDGKPPKYNEKAA